MFVISTRVKVNADDVIEDVELESLTRAITSVTVSECPSRFIFNNFALTGEQTVCEVFLKPDVGALVDR